MVVINKITGNRRPGKSKDWQMMLRLRNPGGEDPGKLFLALDELSEKLGNGTLRATTRQAFQMHGIRTVSYTHLTLPTTVFV